MKKLVGLFLSVAMIIASTICVSASYADENLANTKQDSIVIDSYRSAPIVTTVEVPQSALNNYLETGDKFPSKTKLIITNSGYASGLNCSGPYSIDYTAVIP